MKRSISVSAARDAKGGTAVRREGAIAALIAALVPALIAGPAANAQEWSGSLGIAGVVQDESGSSSSFRTQTQLDEGFFLEGLTLHHEAEDGGTFDLEAWGIGDAEPAWHARAEWKPAGPEGDWKLEFRFDRRESFFGLETTELGLRSDDWRLNRWRGSVEWEGWKTATLGFDLRYHERTGTVNRPLLGLNALYLLAVDLDETLHEATFRLETKDLPVSILFEQSLARFERRNDRRPAEPEVILGQDPDLFSDAFDSREEERDVPTSRLLVTWGNPRVEVAGSLLYSPAEVEAAGAVSSSFDIDGGAVGRIDFVDEVMTSADLDTFAGNVRLGFLLAPRWTLRLEGDIRDRSTDAELLGRRLVRAVSPLGEVLELPALLDERTFFDVTDERQRATLEWSGRGWTVWGGAFAAERDIEWRLTPDDPIPEGVAELSTVRDSDGWLAGVSWRRGAFSGNAEYETGEFESFVFRTEPETVDRLKVRLRSALGGGWDLSLRGRLEDSDNPEAVAGLDHSSDAYGLGLGWTSTDTRTGFGLDIDRVDIDTATDLVLPNGTPGLSRYDLSLTTLGVQGRTEWGKARLSGSATRVEDDGDTWPVESWIARARVAFDVASRTELALLGELWSYDEERAEADDYDVTRLGVAVRWRFE